MASRSPVNEQVDIKNSWWSRWFSDVSDILTAPNWDSGTRTVIFNGLAGSFSANINFVRHGKILFFDLLIEPTGFIISTLGTTYFELPSLKVNGGSNIAIAALGYGSLNAFDVETTTDLGQGYIKVKDPLELETKAYIPTFNTDKKVSVTGWVRIQGL